MIGKIMKNHSFRKTCAYVFGKEGAKIIGGNMGGRNFKEIYWEFGMSGTLNPLVKRPVYHFALSFAPDEPIEDEMFDQIGRQYVERMGLDLAANQFVMVKHTDQAHHHIHIVASRLHIITGKAVPTWKDQYRNQVACRQIELEYGLRQVESTYMTEGMQKKLEQDFGLKMPDGPVTGRKTRTSQQTKKLERYGEAVQVKLQDAIDRATQSTDSRNSVNQTTSPLQSVTEVVTQPITMPQFVERLQAMGVQVQIRWVTDRKKTKATGDRHEKVQGISYQLEGVAMAGNDLGAWYTFPGLQKHRGIDYQSDRDDELLKILAPRVELETDRAETVNAVPLDRPMTMKDLLGRSDAGQDEVNETDVPVEDAEDATEGSDEDGPVETEWKLLPSFANVRHVEAIAPREGPVDAEETDGDDEDGGMGGRTRQSDDEDGGSQNLLDAIEGERLLEQVYTPTTTTDTTDEGNQPVQAVQELTEPAKPDESGGSDDGGPTLRSEATEPYQTLISKAGEWAELLQPVQPVEPVYPEPIETVGSKPEGAADSEDSAGGAVLEAPQSQPSMEDIGDLATDPSANALQSDGPEQKRTSSRPRKSKPAKGKKKPEQER